MKKIRRELEERYNYIFDQYNLERPINSEKVGEIIRQSFVSFLKNSKKPCIYCNGGHTKMLMADFMYELKSVKYIVDNYADSRKTSGFNIIKDEEIESSGIDSIILSTHQFRNEVKNDLKIKHPQIPVLDIYDEFANNNLNIQTDYYLSNHPYQHYNRINYLQREILRINDNDELKDLYLNLITIYIQIKDFRTALSKITEWEQKGIANKKDTNILKNLKDDLKSLYDLEKKAASSLLEDHVIMLCLDGLRNQDLTNKNMPKLNEFLDRNGYRFSNAYSFSTSTFESLIPVYSENDDLRTRYYETNTTDIEDCRFASFAAKQNREIYIYGDGTHYIQGNSIHYRESFSTVTEKLWEFILDASEVQSGLFYLHELYESHFSFPNPYTEMPLTAEGSAMLFDFLPAKGGHLRTDYAKQHLDALKYIDDVLTPLLSCMRCRMIVYADHGNLILDYNTKISDIGEMECTCSEQWTKIPLILCSPETGTGNDNRLVSLMELNNMVICLLSAKAYQLPEIKHIKIARSELYNPNFRYLYHLIRKEYCLYAFECFIFSDGIKIIIYSNGLSNVYDTNDCVVSNIDKAKYIKKILSEITVCEYHQLQKNM